MWKARLENITSVFGFHGLRAWPLLALGFRNLRLNRTFSGFGFLCFGFSGFC